VRLEEAKEKFKKKREEAYIRKQEGPFKDLFRSKGFFWLSNRPNLFFEWSHATVQMNICVGGPWVCTLKGVSLEEQAEFQDIGDRSQNLIFIGQNMKEHKEKIIKSLNYCLVTRKEWKVMVENKFTQEVENDPFKDSVPDDEDNK